jgi:hypothetical protein
MTYNIWPANLSMCSHSSVYRIEWGEKPKKDMKPWPSWITSDRQFHYRLIFYLGKKSIFPERAYYNISKIANFANFVYFCISCGNCYYIWAENGSNFFAFIFRILQHFATKHCNFTNFIMLFLAVVIYLHLLA